MQHEADDSTEAQPSIGQRRRKPYAGKPRPTLNAVRRDGDNFGVDKPAPWLRNLLTPHSAAHRIRHLRRAGWGALRAIQLRRPALARASAVKGTGASNEIKATARACAAALLAHLLPNGSVAPHLQVRVGRS